MFDVLKFLRDNSVDFITEGNKHAGTGWINIHCPFCEGSQNYHLGIHIEQGYGHCWRGKGKSLQRIVKALAHCGADEAKRIIQQYSDGRVVAKESPVKVSRKSSVKLPIGCNVLSPRHWQYLEGRNFDPDLLTTTYGLKGTGPIGDYKHRVIAPIYFEKKLVSYQGRDITGRSLLRYKACKTEDEAIHHKHILYGWDLAVGDSCAIVEGITDCWRFGPGSLGTFGTGYTSEQAQLIVQRFKRIFLIMDPEPAAQKTAEELAWFLGYKGKEVHIVDSGFNCDPGDLKQSIADEIMRDLNLKGWR